MIDNFSILLHDNPTWTILRWRRRAQHRAGNGLIILFGKVFFMHILYENGCYNLKSFRTL